MSGDRDKVPPSPREAAIKQRAENRAKVAATAIRGAKLTARSVEALSVAGVQKVMPLLMAYVGPQYGGDSTGESPIIDPATGAAAEPAAGRLSRQERLVLNAVATKLFVELVEITSRTDPIYKDAPVYEAYNDGVLRTPHLSHILSLGVAANRLLSQRGQTQPPAPEPSPANDKSVAYLAVAPGEYVEDPGPLSPSVIRRSAMRERSYNPPARAMLARQSNQFSTSAAGAAPVAYGVRGAASYGALRSRQSAYSTAGPGQAGYGRSGGCRSCGGRSGGCQTCGGSATSRDFAPARRKADGSCEKITSISCDTQWRVRECLKVAVCDLIRCVGEELCDEDGQFAQSPDLGACLERFVCSIVTCLPEAICPPPEREEACCPPAIDCDCNFAVGD